MADINQWWWRHALVAGATTALLLTSGCGTSPTTAGAKTSGPCTALPVSDVPPLQKALTETDRGTYCARRGVTILIVLKGKDFSATTAWATPSIDGPNGGVSSIAPPLTALRGTTIAAVRLNAPGAYTFSSTTPDHESWQAVVSVD